MPVLANSLQGTEVDCPLQVDGQGQLVLTIGIRNCFDYFFSSTGEKTESQLTADIRQYLTGLLPETAQPYAFQLLDKYIAYLHGRSTLPSAKTNAPDGFNTALSALKDLRRQIFTVKEAAVFFGNEELYDQYAIAQYNINNDKRLTAKQKADKSAELISQQPASLVASMRPILQYNQLQQLTSEIQARGGSPAELRQMRESLVGAAAADRLEQADVEEGKWQSQVDRYLAARDQIAASGVDPAQQQSAISELRNQSFRTPEERIRAQTFESMHDSSLKKQS
ncbi:lipase chaperone [Aquirhabdus parva]|uniref:Lipase chaperone n=2 Tax=Aquirhabdus parva TaxID=2283318 RepID=A0A345PBQ0_9GAMM|nr:lipase chaperone [Aquirhabdus parva]